MFKKKFLIVVVIIFSLFLVGGSLTVGKNSHPFVQKLKGLLPDSAKTLLKKTVFAIPILYQKHDQQQEQIKFLAREIGGLKSKLSVNTDYTFFKMKSREILSKSNNKYEITMYRLNLPDHDELGKPIAYVDQTKSHVFLATGDGNILSFEKDKIGLNEIEYYPINTNIGYLIHDEEFYQTYALSIKDILIKDDKIYFSFGNIKDKCFYFNIFRSDLSLKYLKFKKFFARKECKGTRNFMNYQHIGGRIVSFKDNKILVTVGDFGDEDIPQDMNSIFGKIFSFASFLLYIN